MEFPSTDLRPGLTRILHEHIRKGKDTIVLAEEPGMGREYHLCKVVEDLQQNFQKYVHVVLNEVTSRKQLVDQAHYCLYHKSHSWSESFQAYEGNKGEQVKQAILGSSHQIHVFVSNLEQFSNDMLFALQSWRCPNITFICACAQTRKQGVVDFVKSGRFSRLHVRPVSNQALICFARALLLLNGMNSRILHKKQRAIVRASGGNPGKLVTLLSDIEKENSEELIENVLKEYLGSNMVQLFVEEYLIIVAVGGMTLSFLMHSLSYSLAILVVSVIMGGCSLVLYRLLSRVYKPNTILDI